MVAVLVLLGLVVPLLLSVCDAVTVREPVWLWLRVPVWLAVTVRVPVCEAVPVRLEVCEALRVTVRLRVLVAVLLGVLEPLRERDPERVALAEGVPERLPV